MKPPFNGVYAPNVTLVVLTLLPQLINTSAYQSLAAGLARDLHTAPAQIARYPIYSEAAFVYGILVGTTLVRRFDIRPLFMSLLAADILAVVIMSFARSDVMMSALATVTGLIGGAFLMVALPPLFMNFEEKYFPASAALMVPCLFGAATLAPIVCAPLAAAGLWRPLFWGEAFVLTLALGLAFLTIGSKVPPQKDAPVDWFALGVGAASMAGVFVGAANAGTHEWTYLPALVPFVAGVAGFAVLIIAEYFMKNGLLPVKAIVTSFAVIGFVTAAAGNALYIADNHIFSILAERVLHLEPLQIAAHVWPLCVMTVLTGLAFALVLRTKWMPLLPLSGLVALCIGSGFLLASIAQASPAAHWASIALIGYGASATVTPGLFMVGLSIARDLVARGIAVIEVVRLTVGFISGPLAQHSIVAHARNEQTIAKFVVSGAVTGPAKTALYDLQRGMQSTLEYVIGFAAFASVVTIVLLFAYYRKPHAPDLRRYVREGKPAFESPPL